MRAPFDDMGNVLTTIVQWESGVCRPDDFLREQPVDDGVEMASQTASTFYQTPGLM